MCDDDKYYLHLGCNGHSAVQIIEPRFDDINRVMSVYSHAASTSADTQLSASQIELIRQNRKLAQRRKAMKRRLRYNGEAARDGEKTPTQASPLPLSYKCILQS